MNGALSLALSEWFDRASSHCDVDLLVHGVDDSGGQHSLLGCFQTSLVLSSELPAFPQRWHVDAHLAGAHLTAADEPALSMRVDIPSLLSWSGLGALNATESDGSVASLVVDNRLVLVSLTVTGLSCTSINRLRRAATRSRSTARRTSKRHLRRTDQ